MRKIVAGASLLLLSWATLGVSVAAAQYEPPLLHFSASAAEAAFDGQILQHYPGASFPASEGHMCPETYTGSEGEYSVCYAEFKTGGTWHLEGGQADSGPSGVTVKISTRAQWRRAWVRCPLPHGSHGAPGRLFSNYNCGRGQVSDAYLVTVEIYPSIKMHQPVKEAGWQFTESAGFTSLGVFHAQRHERTYLFRNAMGDAFRYTP
jgi:hypothetical protein